MELVEENAATEAGGVTAEELAAVREVILRAHPDVVAELVSGGTIGELIGSVAGARAAYEGVVSRQPAVVAAPPVAPFVPAGGATAVIDPGSLPAAEKIRRGLAASR